MDWMKITAAIALGLMLAILIPRAKDIFAATPRAEAGDWQAFILPLLAVIGFVAGLMWLVHGGG